MTTSQATTHRGTSTEKPAAISRLSIIIPAYNEIRTIERVMQRVMAAPLPCERELVVVDDGSRDGTREFLREFAKHHSQVRFIGHSRNRGKGAAIRSALQKVTGDWIIIQDADLEYDPNDYQRMLEPVLEGVADAVYGSRFLSGRYRRAMLFWHSAANKALVMTSNILNDLNLTDVGTCYKLVRADILKNLVLRSDGFAIEAEITAKLARFGARIYEVPISYRGRGYEEGKKIRVRDAVATLLAMFRYRLSDRDYVKHDGFMILQAVARAKRFNKWLYDQFRGFLGEEILEAGSGIGNLTELLLDRRRLVAVDYEDFYVRRLDQAWGHLANFRVQRADLTKWDDIQDAAQERPFDSIVCINVLEHIEESQAVLQNFFRALKPGGRAVILVPHDPALYSAVDRTLGHVKRYTRSGLKSDMERAGFRVISVKGFNRIGGLGWRISGQILRKETLTAGQMTLFELGMPLIRLLELLPFHSHNSVIAIGEKPATSGKAQPS